MMPFELSDQAPQTTPFERIGGRDAVRRLVADFYARVSSDALLRPLFPEDLGPGIERQQLFMEQWLGGAPRYSETHGHPMLRRRHFPFVIGRAHAARWLEHMRGALADSGASTELVDEIMQRLQPLALHMVNEGQDVPRTPLPR